VGGVGSAEPLIRDGRYGRYGRVMLAIPAVAWTTWTDSMSSHELTVVRSSGLSCAAGRRAPAASVWWSMYRTPRLRLRGMVVGRVRHNGTGHGVGTSW